MCSYCFHSFQYHLPTDVLTEQNLPSWMQVYQAVLDQQIPEVGNDLLIGKHINAVIK